MEQIVLMAHVIIAIAITGLILMQQGKGADMGASFGGGSSQTLFGSGGSGNLLTRLTTLLVVLFFVSSLSLAVFAKQKVNATVDVAPAIIQDNNMNAEEVPALDVDKIDAVNQALPESEIPAAINEIPAAADEEIPSL